jgi:uncharacterized protein YjbI with pentapeptide repeats
MANPEHLAKLDEGVEAWNQWRAGQAFVPDLRGAALRGKDLSSANLRGADLRGAGFSETNLSGASLREANLQGVDLSVAHRGLQTEQLAGADLTGAKLPDELTKLYEKLQNVNNISESARKLFLAVLAACLYSWLTIATTTDVGLITNRASSPLPIIQTSIPIVGFYWVAPLLLLCVYFYFHFYLQKLWEELGSLPAIFPDGRPLHSKIDPWLLNDLVRSHLPKLNVNRPFLSYLQLWISVLLAWWVVPITMFLFWGRYLPRQDRVGTTFHVVLLAISVATALRLYRLAVATLRGVWRGPFRWRSLSANHRGYLTTGFAVALGLLFGLVSWGARWGVPSNAPIFGIPLLHEVHLLLAWDTGGLTWVPRVMAVVGYSPFANLEGAEVSQKKSTWSRNYEELDSVVVANLERVNLRHAWAPLAFLAGANLTDADLRGAFLYQADLRRANLNQTVLSEASLRRADLRGSSLFLTHLNSASLYEADLSAVHLDSADLSNTEMSLANLRHAYLINSQLSGARMVSAHLNGAQIINTDLRDVLFHGADLTDADIDGRLDGSEFSGANLFHTDLRGAENLNPDAVKSALYWDKALYNDEMLRALGLPPDHNAKLVKEQRKEKELQQKQDAGQTGTYRNAPNQE